jgi:HlyD family secretion protein
MYHHLFLAFLAMLVIPACGGKHSPFEASGVFEAREIVVSALNNGQILELDLDEGASLTADQVVGHLDCEDLELQKRQIASSKDALSLKQVEARPETSVIQQQIITQQSQIAALQTQYDVLAKERDRLKPLVAEQAVPAKQLDDILGQMDVLNKQINSAREQVGVFEVQIKSSQRTASMRNRSIMSEDDPLQSQIDRVDNLIQNCTIVNPISGTVIAKYAEPFEFITTGKAIYKIADLSAMTLRAYLTGDQLATISLGQQVRVQVDDGKGAFKGYSGTISWISEKAEFTPKTIQTKNERANLVYAVKVNVKNDGYLRIGMYGELDF